MMAFRSMRYPVDEGCRAGAQQTIVGEGPIPCARPWEDYYEGLGRADKRPTRTYTGAFSSTRYGFFSRCKLVCLRHRPLRPPSRRKIGF